jgi:folate-binding protein YgfZ
VTAPATYGDVTAEYLAARREAAVVHTGREMVWVRGPDTVTFLDGLLSQSIGAMEVGELAPSLLLSPRGKLRALLWVLRGDGEVGLVADSNVGAQVIGDLGRFKIRVDVDLVADSAPTVEVWGPSSPEVVAAAGLPVPETRGWLHSDAGAVARLPLGQSTLERIFVGGASGDALVTAGGTRVGLLAATAVRIEAGEPLMGVDVDEGTIPQEAGLVEAAVDFDKGCYLGQELVARIDSRGRVNRRLRGLVVRGAVIPPPGAVVRADGQELGEVTSAGESFELRAPVAMATIRREAEPGAVVELAWEGGSASAVVRSLPLDSFVNGRD